MITLRNEHTPDHNRWIGARALVFVLGVLSCTATGGATSAVSFATPIGDSRSCDPPALTLATDLLGVAPDEVYPGERYPASGTCVFWSRVAAAEFAVVGLDRSDSGPPAWECGSSHLTTQKLADINGTPVLVTACTNVSTPPGNLYQPPEPLTPAPPGTLIWAEQVDDFPLDPPATVGGSSTTPAATTTATSPCRGSRSCPPGRSQLAAGRSTCGATARSDLVTSAHRHTRSETTFRLTADCRSSGVRSSSPPTTKDWAPLEFRPQPSCSPKDMRCSTASARGRRPPQCRIARGRRSRRTLTRGAGRAVRGRDRPGLRRRARSRWCRRSRARRRAASAGGPSGRVAVQGRGPHRRDRAQRRVSRTRSRHVPHAERAPPISQRSRRSARTPQLLATKMCRPARSILRESSTTPDVALLLEQNSPGVVAPAVPVFIGHGDADQQVPVALSETLTATYCALGATVGRRVYPGQDHDGVIDAAADDAMTFITDRYDQLEDKEDPHDDLPSIC